MLLPDVLGTYSDAGNALILAQRARWRGIRTRVLDITATTVPPASCDIYLLGGGEDGAEVFAADWLARYPALRHAMSTTAVTLLPLGWVTRGVGNGTADRSGHRGDGACTGRIIGTYLHGPVLARNPALADHILASATGATLAPLELPDQAQQRRRYLKAGPD